MNTRVSRQRTRTSALLMLMGLLSALASIDAEAMALGSGNVRTLEIGIVALLLLQTGLIVVLMIQNRRQRRMQDAAQRQQTEVTHAARLVLVGEMTASIAHEVSQPLGAILSNADAAEMLLRADPPDLDEVRRILDDIRRDDMRAHEIVCNLRKLLSKRELRMESIDVNDVVRTTLSLARSDAIRRGIMVRTTLDEHLPPAAGDPIHLQQVMLNLIINAMDSMSAVTLQEKRIDVFTRRHDADSIEVAVIDNGCGIPQEQTARIFDSFYSTKSDGMGLGLSIARAIVQTHGGSIWAENNPGSSGARLRFTIPLAA